MKARKPEGLLSHGHDRQDSETARPAARFALGQLVSVQLWERVPPGDPDGDFKDTGRSFEGSVAHGPTIASFAGDTITENTVYVMPLVQFDHDNKHGPYGNTHPRPISGLPFEVALGPAGAVTTLKFVVEAIDLARQTMAETETTV